MPAPFAAKPLRVSRYRDLLTRTHAFTTDTESQQSLMSSFAREDVPDGITFSPFFYLYTEQHGGTVPIYRFRAPNGSMLFAANQDERGALLKRGLVEVEQPVFIYNRKLEGSSELFRIVNPNDGDVIYTASPEEKDYYLKQGWTPLSSLGFAQSTSSSGTGILRDTTVKFEAAADFDGNGTPDLVWQNLSTRQVTVNYYGQVGGVPTLIGWNWLNSAGSPGWTVVGATDFNADGVPDLVWQNDTTRQVSVNFYGGAGGAVFEGWNWVNSAGAPGWTVAGVADFDGNGEPDLVWQNTANGQVSVNYYNLGGAVLQGWNWLNTANNTAWRVVGTGDFDGNGVPDLVWQNLTTRQVTVNYYGGTGGTTLTGWAYLNATGSPGWSVVAVADMNGDGVPDLIWQNDTTKQITVNYYGGTGGATLTGWSYLNATGAPGWTVVAAADFDGNGTPDLVWQNLSTGQVTVNYYGGTGGATLLGSNWLSTATNTAWTVVGAADFDGNGVPDLVWENPATGQVKVNYYGGPGGATLKGWNWLNNAGSPGWRAIVPKSR